MNYEILEIVPHVKVGAFVHWHDIVIPANWKESITNGNMFWNESYMVHAFMLFNDSFKVQWATRYMTLTQWDRMAAAFPYLTREHHLTSFWVQRTR